MSNGEDNRYRSRRFLFACFVELVATAAFVYFGHHWVDKPAQVMALFTQWTTVSSIILGIYGVSSFVEKKITVGGKQ